MRCASTAKVALFSLSTALCQWNRAQSVAGGLATEQCRVTLPRDPNIEDVRLW
jgi:hypothetical protein